MNIANITLVPMARIIFTPEEVDLLNTCSQLHYDMTCRAQSDKDGILTNMRRQLTHSETAEISLRFYDVDLLCKIAESPLCPAAIRTSLAAILQRLGEEFDKHNPR